MDYHLAHSAGALSSSWGRLWLPYACVALRPTSRRRHPALLPVNRDYQPLGRSRADFGFCDWQAFADGQPQALLQPDIRPMALPVWTTWALDERLLYLYRSGDPETARTYFERLSVLLSHCGAPG